MKSTLNGPSQGVEGPENPRPINHRQIPPGVGAQSATIAILHGDYWVSGTVGNLGSGFPMSRPSCEIEQGSGSWARLICNLARFSRQSYHFFTATNVLCAWTICSQTAKFNLCGGICSSDFNGLEGSFGRRNPSHLHEHDRKLANVVVHSNSI